MVEFICMFMKKKLNVTFITSESDLIMWIKQDGKLFNLIYNASLCFICNAPQGSERPYQSENDTFNG